MRGLAQEAESLAKLRGEVDQLEAGLRRSIDYQRRKESGELTAEELEAAREGSRRNMIAFYGYDWEAEQAKNAETRYREYQLPGMAKAEDLDFVPDFAEEADDDGWDDSMIEFSRRDNEKTARSGGDMCARNVNGKSVVWIEDNILAEAKGVPTHQYIADYIAEHIGEVYTIIESGQKVYIGEDLPGEYTQSEYTKSVLKKNPNIVKAKNRAVVNLGGMIEIATHRRWERTKHPGSKDAKYGMYRHDTSFGFPVKDHKGKAIRANIYTAELLVRNASDDRKYLYDIVKIKKDTASSDWLTKKMASAAANTAGQKGDVSKESVAQDAYGVNTKFSARDSEGRELTEEQREFFKDSKVRDADGNLMVMYHGTDGDFYEFDAGRNSENTGNGGFYRKCFYFTTSRADAYNLRPPPAIPLPPLGAMARHRMHHGPPRE